MNVSVFGLGYVGCVTAACLARDGHRVIGIDINPDKVNAINQGLSPIVEPRLGDIVARAVQAGRLRATMSPDDAIDRSDVALICVGTPDLGHGLPDLGALLNVAEAIIERARAVRTHPLTVVVRSTGLPGTTTRVFEQVMTDRASRPSMIRLAMNPEFMREGSSVEDFEHPPLIVVGCDDAETAHQLRQLYAAIDAPLVHTTIRTAEMVKYANNAFHALKVSFANEIAGLCDALEVDGQEVMAIVRQDRKLNIAPSYLKPGFAFGGSCLPKDLRALLHAGRVADVSIPMLNAVMTSNESQIRHGIERVLQTRARRVGVVGLAFKPGTDDLRESPMVAVVEALIGKGFDVRIYDSNIVPSRLTGANRRYIDIEIPHIGSLLCDSAEALVVHAQVLVIGSSGEEASRVIAAASAAHTIIDLTRSWAPPIARQTASVHRATARSMESVDSL
jgi:GDP-mannose 6-dehydrogenase